MVSINYNYWTRGKFVSLNEMVTNHRSVTPDQFKSMTQEVLANLQVLYLFAGSTDDVAPDFPDGTWDGKVLLQSKS